MNNSTNKLLPTSLFKFFWFFIKKYKYSFFLSLLTRALFSEIPYLLLCPYALKLLVDGITDNTITFLYGTFLIFIYCFADFWLIIKPVNSHLVFNSYTKAIEDMRNRIFNHIIQQSNDFFNSNFSGELNEKINNLLDNLEPSISAIVSVISNFILLFICVIVFARENIAMGLVIFIWFLSFAFITNYFSKKQSQLRKTQVENYNRLNGFITDDFINISNIKNFSTQDYEKQKINKHLNIVEDMDFKIAKLEKTQGTINFIMNFSLVASFTTICIKMFLDNKFQLGTLFFLLDILRRVSDYSQYFSLELSEALKNIATIRVGLQLITQKIEIEDKPNAKLLDSPKGKISFKNITFSYKKI